MIMKTIGVRILAITVGALLIFQGCKKDDKTDSTSNNENERSLTAVKASSDVFFDDVSQEVLKVNTESNLSAREAGVQGCAEITVSPAANVNEWPKTVTVNFGTTGCTADNGFVRKGKIIYIISKKLINTGAVITITFDNYTVNGHKLEGTYTIRNTGTLASIQFNTTLENGKITYPDGSWYTKTSNVNWTYAAGSFTPSDFSDDVFNLSGSGTVTSSDGNTLTAESQDVLVRKYTCYNIVSGKLNLTYNNINGVLDYGNGECDKKAVLTIGNKNYDITLP
jgi:hypothetical protein